MVDKRVNDGYIWYSGATDATGKALAEALKMKHGSTKPGKEATIVIGWGAKTNDSTNLGNVPVLNHPDKIRDNRHKFNALSAMKAAGVNVAEFLSAKEVAKIGKPGCNVVLPVIGRTNFHQGGKGFWSCPTMTHVNAAVEEGANYFQNLIEIKDEYRLHTVFGKVIYSVKKTKRSIEEMEEAFVKQEKERQLELAKKNGDKLDEKTVEVFLRRQAKKFAQDGANMMIRSNRLGWKFVHVKTISKELEAEAVKACKAIGLDFGAVDCCVDASGKAWVIEVNSGPGLEETTFKTWVAAFEGKLAEIFTPAKPLSPKKEETAAKKSEPTTGKSVKKNSLAERVRLMQDMVEAADEDEVAVLDKVFAKMFGK